MKSFIISLIVTLFLQAPYAFSSSKIDSLNSKIKRLASKYRNIDISLELISLKTGKTIISHNPDLKLNPASAMKVVTAASALDYLRPEFTFKTKILTTGRIKNSVLKGNIYILASGDPTFVTEQMYILADNLSRKGFRRIEGDIVIDDSVFNFNEEENNRVYKDNRAYNANISPLVFNFNTTTLYVEPAAKPGFPLRVFVDPDNSYIKIKNKTTTSRGAYSLSLRKEKSYSEKEIYRVTGALPITSDTKRFYKIVDKPSNYFSSVFRDFLKKKGIEIRGKTRNGKTPASARVLAVSESRPISFIIKDLFTFSNNLIAENIVRAMGSKFRPQLNSHKAGLDVMKNYIKNRTSADIKSILLYNGSGLSRKNRISAKALNRIMYSSFKDFTISPELINSFCVSGTTGTIKDRFSPKLKEKIRAKTGTLNGVASLAGIYSGKNDSYVFTVIANKKNAGDLRYIIDRIMNQIGGVL